MFGTRGKSRLGGRLAALLSAAVLGGGLALAGVAPAQAADSNTYVKNARFSGWAFSANAVDDALVTAVCCGPTTVWRYQPRQTSPSGHALVKLQNNANGGCMDSARSLNAVATRGCNTGTYQLWEVFNNSGGTRTYKSWGAWVNQGAHVCMSASDSTDWLRLGPCNVDNRTQWRNAR